MICSGDWLFAGIAIFTYEICQPVKVTDLPVLGLDIVGEIISTQAIL